MKLKLLSLIAFSVIGFVAVSKAADMDIRMGMGGAGEENKVDTRMSKVITGDQGDCYYNAAAKEIVCTDGKTYSNVETVTGSATGTPPWLQYNNPVVGMYLGQTMGARGTRAGAGTRTIYIQRSTSGMPVLAE